MSPPLTVSDSALTDGDAVEEPTSGAATAVVAIAVLAVVALVCLVGFAVWALSTKKTQPVIKVGETTATPAARTADDVEMASASTEDVKL